MGNTCASLPEHRSKLVIIGGSLGGLEAYQALHKYFEIKIIDAKDFLELPPAMHYYYTGQVTHESISLLYENSILRDSFIHGKAIELHSNAVVVRTVNGLQTIEFDYCLIATGALYGSSMKPNFELKTLSEHRAKIKTFQAKVLAAKKVLVRGAGIVGVEVAAELATLGKQVVLSCPRGQILPKFTPKVQNRSLPCLNEVGVKIVDSNKAKISLEDFDLVYDCLGNTYPIEDNILNKNFSNYLDEKGRVRVNEFFQVSDQNFKPLQHIFAVGDCCITLANEEKNIPNLKNAAKIVAHNLKELALRGQEGLSRFKQFPKKPSDIKVLALISLGRQSILIIGNLTMMGEYLTKMKKNNGPKMIKELTLKEKRV